MGDPSGTPEVKMRNIKLVIEYDGTNYHGWQSQQNAKTIQNILEEAICKLTGENCSLIGSSRTDSGVHALGQVANFITGSRIPAGKFAYALNSILPDDIVIKRSLEVELDFHSTHSAKAKKYRYLIHNSVFPSALLKNRAFHVSYPLDMEAMRKAVSYFIGKHDFRAFCASGSSVKTSVRTVFDAHMNEVTDMFKMCGSSVESRLICIEISGDGFLYNMVRIIAGTLIEVGMGRRKAEDMPGIIEGRDRKKAGKTAPAHGLYLVEVYY